MQKRERHRKTDLWLHYDSFCSFLCCLIALSSFKINLARGKRPHRYSVSVGFVNEKKIIRDSSNEELLNLHHGTDTPVLKLWNHSTNIDKQCHFIISRSPHPFFQPGNCISVDCQLTDLVNIMEVTLDESLNFFFH